MRGDGTMVDMAHETVEPEYPYGLSLHLSDEVLEKLGLKAEDYKIGDTLPLDAVAKVTGISQHEGYSCLDLQITDLGIETDKDEDVKSVGERIYG
jgi:major coat protein